MEQVNNRTEHTAMRYFTKKDLIQAYTGDRFTLRTGYRWLERELTENPGLMERLVALGYKPKQSHLTRSQVRAIIEVLGEP